MADDLLTFINAIDKPQSSSVLQLEPRHLDYLVSDKGDSDKKDKKDRMMETIGLVTAMLKASAGASADIIKDASSTCLVLLGAVRNMRYNKAAFIELLGNATNVIYLIYTAEKAAPDPATWLTPPVREIVEELLGTLANLEKSINEHLKRSRPLRFIHNSEDQKTIENFQTQFKHALARFQVLSHIHINQEIQHIIQTNNTQLSDLKAEESAHPTEANVPEVPAAAHSPQPNLPLVSKPQEVPKPPKSPTPPSPARTDDSHDSDLPGKSGRFEGRLALKVELTASKKKPQQPPATVEDEPEDDRYEVEKSDESEEEEPKRPPRRKTRPPRRRKTRDEEEEEDQEGATDSDDDPRPARPARPSSSSRPSAARPSSSRPSPAAKPTKRPERRHTIPEGDDDDTESLNSGFANMGMGSQGYQPQGPGYPPHYPQRHGTFPPVSGAYPHYPGYPTPPPPPPAGVPYPGQSPYWGYPPAPAQNPASLLSSFLPSPNLNYAMSPGTSVMNIGSGNVSGNVIENIRNDNSKTIHRSSKSKKRGTT